MDLKGDLHADLRAARAANLRALDGLSEYELRRPLTPTGTSLLGVVKHLAAMEYGYLSETFGRTVGGPIPGDEAPEDESDMWAGADESSGGLLDWYRRACALADESVHRLHLDAPGIVRHWPEGRRATTLGAMMRRVLGEELRHGGHLDVVRELIDGRTGEVVNPGRGAAWWQAHCARVQSAADTFR